MIHAYDKLYLDKAQTVLGRMLDFAVYDLGYRLSEFFDLFLSSGAAARFEKGDSSIIAGLSGVELAYAVLSWTGIPADRVRPAYPVDRSEEFWTGWALAYYQWETALRFAEIVRYVPITQIICLYSPYHEMDIRQFCDKMDELYRAAKPETNLNLLRKRAGLSQRELAIQSGVPVRTIQQYEQRQRSINKAQAEYLRRLSHVLCCTMEELMEKDVRPSEYL